MNSYCILKGEGHSRKLAFFVFAYGKLTFSFYSHRRFSLWTAHYPEEIQLERSTSVAAILNLSRQPGHVYVTSFGPTRNWRQGEKPATDSASFTRPVKSFFFQPFFHFTNVNAITSEFRACLAQNNMANPKWYIKTSSEAISRTELRKRAWLLSTVQNGDNDNRILGFHGFRVETNSTRKTCSLEAETSVCG